MTVKQLITKLQKLEPDANVYLETFADNEARKVMSATNWDGDSIVYIGDDFEDLKYELKQEGYKTTIIR